MNKEILPGRTLNKTLRTRSMYDMNERIKMAEYAGYKLVGRIVETSNGSFHALMRKEVIFKERT